MLITVHKQRAQRFNEGACAMEMTELSVHRQPWWTLAFDVFDRPGDDGLGRALILCLRAPLAVSRPSTRSLLSRTVTRPG